MITQHTLEEPLLRTSHASFQLVPSHMRHVPHRLELDAGRIRAAVLVNHVPDVDAAPRQIIDHDLTFNVSTAIESRMHERS